jgi:uncharacterized membrane protein YhaH (DUF805 family)
MEWMLLPYRRYADFTGRSRRMEYWMFMLFFYLVLFALLMVFVAASGPSYDAAGEGGSGAVAVIFIGVMIVFFLGSFIPMLAVQVRRFHDQDLSGWLVLLNLIPYLGGLVVFVFMCLKGTTGDNSYGPDPLGGAAADVFA